MRTDSGYFYYLTLHDTGKKAFSTSFEVDNEMVDHPDFIDAVRDMFDLIYLDANDDDEGATIPVYWVLE